MPHSSGFFPAPLICHSTSFGETARAAAPRRRQRTSSPGCFQRLHLSHLFHSLASLRQPVLFSTNTACIPVAVSASMVTSNATLRRYNVLTTKTSCNSVMATTD